MCGEETALIASIEGQRGMPRPRPPFPAISGLWGKPTVINNVETLACVALILRHGAEWFAQYGTAQSKGTKTFALVGKVKRPGLVEVPLGITLREMIFEIGGGTGRRPAVQGGPDRRAIRRLHSRRHARYPRRLRLPQSGGQHHGLRRHGGHGRHHLHGRFRPVLHRFRAKGIVWKVPSLPAGYPADA